MEVWLNPVLAASRHDLLILLLQSSTPPLFAHSVYDSFFSPTPPSPLYPHSQHDFPLLFLVVFHTLFHFVANVLLDHLKNFSEGRAPAGGEEDKLIKQTTTALKCTDMLLCTAGLQPVLQHSGGLRLSEVRGQEDRKGHQLHAQEEI